MSSVVFLTGGTGFIGTQVARCLIEQTDSRIFVLVRGENKENAFLRLKRAWWEWSELSCQIGNRIEVIFGDISEPCFGLNNTEYQHLVQNITHVIHAAADTTPNLALNVLRKINVTGTSNVIQLAKDANCDHRLGRLSYVSTAYVAGKRRGTIKENDLTNKSGFCSNYEQTKHESEVLINEVKHELPVSVFRPPGY